MSRCTPGHGWTSRKRRLGGADRIGAIRAKQEGLLHGRRVVLRIALRQIMDDALQPVAVRDMRRARIESQLAQLKIEEDFLVGSPLRVLSKGTLIALGILEEDLS